MKLAEIVQRGWDAVGAGDFDALVTDYTDDMVFIMPGQGDVLNGRQAFRKALDGLGEILPPGFAEKILQIFYFRLGGGVSHNIDFCLVILLDITQDLKIEKNIFFIKRRNSLV